MERPSKVSIVVPLAGGPAQALRCLEGIAQGRGVDYEVIVVDDASVGLAPLLGALEGDVKVIRSDRRIGLSAAAQLGFGRALGELVVLVRGAAAPEPGWLAPLVAVLQDPTVGLAASSTAGHPDASLLSAWSIALRRADADGISISNVPSQLAFATIALALAERGLRAVTAPESVIAPPGARDGSARRLEGEDPELTIVIPTLDATSARVLACVSATQMHTEAAHQIVIVDNGCPPQGFTAPVNAGVRSAITPYVVVMNDDVEPLPGWWPPLRQALDDGVSVAFPLTVDGPMRRDFAAWCFAIGSEAIATHSHAPGELFDPAFAVWYQDTDLLQRLLLAGRPPVLVERSRIRHGLSQTINSDDEQMRTWAQARIAEDREAFLRKHPDVPLHDRTLARS